MWQLEKIQATNLCAFETLDYTFNQGHTTLVFGNNMDDDSQNSNGSGKSALIEAIAISLTGETLRKVNIDEIINDAHDTATLEAVLVNVSDNLTMTVSRQLARKKPQAVKVTVKDAVKVTDIKQSSVSEYNKYILDTIGLSKDDLFSNFILTAKKYKSFLSSSDKEKKEIINRFSNGILVDESIEALHEDMAPIQENLLDAEKSVASCTGSVSALENEIERAINDSADKSANKKARIEGWKASISENRAEIRHINELMDDQEDYLNSLDELDELLQKTEKSKNDVKASYDLIELKFQEHHLSPITDFAEKFIFLQRQNERSHSRFEETQAQIKSVQKQLSKAQANFKVLSENYKKDTASIDSENEELERRISSLREMVKDASAKESKLAGQRDKISREINKLKQQLAGVIVCPKCHHEFVIDSDLDIDVARKTLGDKEIELNDVENSLSDNKSLYDKYVAEGKQSVQKQSEILDERSKLKREFQSAESSVADIQNDYEKLSRELSSIQMTIDSTVKMIENINKDMFDQAFDTLDRAIKKGELEFKNYELQISNLEGAIRSYEESISEVENAVETDTIAALKTSKEKYEHDLQQAIKDKEEIERSLNELKVQESTFVEFKTHLANTKIDAISQITNDFLETIGSDIRVALSGYTVLKSGKVRDKISVSLIRDGVDCGSFDKFSRGEQTRVELACILAMHELINMNCQGGQGLNLLVIDEILDATDEQGLTNVFKALNETQITSLVVSHGNIAENYPNRLVVNKKNGVSFI